MSSGPVIRLDSRNTVATAPMLAHKPRRKRFGQGYPMLLAGLTIASTLIAGFDLVLLAFGLT
jgi:hypothetical protein